MNNRSIRGGIRPAVPGLRPSGNLMDLKQAQKSVQQFAHFLSERRDQIAHEWLAGVHSDSRLQTSARLTATQLQKHIPHLFEDLNALLQSPADSGILRNAGGHARDHGQERFGEGYELHELLRELARLRATVIVHAIAFEEKTPNFSGVVKRVALQRLHSFFDELVFESAEEFVRDQQAGLRNDADKASEQRRHADARRQIVDAENEQLRHTEASRPLEVDSVSDELWDRIHSAQRTIRELLDDKSVPNSCKESLRILSDSINHMVLIFQQPLDHVPAGGRPIEEPANE
jgi:hypothetical protein